MSAHRLGLWLLGCLSACAAGCVETYDGDGVAAEQVRSVSGFDRVSARGTLQVSLTPGEFAVSVHIDQNLIERVRTTRDGDTLVIDVRGGNLGDVLPGPHVLVSLPSLRDVELNGSGQLDAGEFDEDEAVSVELSGSGELAWSGQTPALDVVLNGAGQMTLTGSAQSVDYYLAGAGSLQASALEARAASIEVQGTGSISATVDGRVDATIAGSGSIEVSGNASPGTLDIDELGTLTGL